jgi:steroid delta-isomerase-like uncharacterized protein
MKYSKLSLLIVVLVLLCTYATPITAQEDRVAANKELAASAVKAFNEADWDVFREAVADDFVLHFALSPVDIVGPEGLIAFFQGFHSAMPDISHPEIELMIADEESVAMLLPTVGTFTNEWNGLPPTGELVSVPLISIWHITDGKLAEAWFGLDTMLLMQQMGAIPVSPDVIPASSEAVAAVSDTQHGDAETSKAVVRSFKLDLLNTQNLDLIPELFTEGFVFHDHADTADVSYTGYAGVSEFLMPYFAMMPDLQFPADELVMMAEGNMVAIYWVARGTQTGAVPDIPASGNEVTVPGLSIYRLEDGKIAETWFTMDMLGFLTQIGLIPPGAE